MYKLKTVKKVYFLTVFLLLWNTRFFLLNHEKKVVYYGYLL